MSVVLFWIVVPLLAFSLIYVCTLYEDAQKWRDYRDGAQQVERGAKPPASSSHATCPACVKLHAKRRHQVVS